jgi:aryl-alcohol dehydrogenase-like predicted oxidoreductase
VETQVTTQASPISVWDFLPAGAPRLGLGCGDLFGGTEEAASLRLLKTAYDCGIRWFDVARLYGNGSAEGVVGRAFQGVRDQVVIVSKAGIVPWNAQTVTRIRRKALTTARRLAPFARGVLPEPPPAKERYGAFGRAELQKSVETSLRALQTDHLDILLLHECELPDATRPETLSLLERLRADGKIRAFGIATRAPQTKAILAAEPARFAVAQFPTDVFSRNERGLPLAWRGLIVTHSIYKGGLGRLRAQVTADPMLAAAWRSRIGRDPAELDGYAEQLLKDALYSHAGMVLFTTSRPERIAPAVAAALEEDLIAPADFRDFLKQAGLRAAA